MINNTILKMKNILNIGWLGYGFLHDDFIAADGGANIRMPIINKLLANGNKIHWLGPSRKQENIITNPNIFFYKKIEPEFVKHYNQIHGEEKKGSYDVINNFEWSENLLPELDVLLVEASTVGIKGILFTKLIDYYFKKKVKIILWDQDNYFSSYKSKLKKLTNKININDLLLITPYNKKRQENQMEIYYPYNKNKELEIKKGKGICYIGNDYKRREQMKNFYDDEKVDVYGKYKDEEFKNELKANFKGSIPPKDVHKITNNYLLSIQIVKKDYERIGLASERINEVLESGTILLIDRDINNARKFVDQKYLVSSKYDVDKMYNYLLSLSEEEYKKLIEEQRNYLQNKLTTRDEIVALIENE